MQSACISCNPRGWWPKAHLNTLNALLQSQALSPSVRSFIRPFTSIALRDRKWPSSETIHGPSNERSRVGSVRWKRDSVVMRTASHSMVLCILHCALYRPADSGGRVGIGKNTAQRTTCVSLLPLGCSDSDVVIAAKAQVNNCTVVWLSFLGLCISDRLKIRSSLW